MNKKYEIPMVYSKQDILVFPSSIISFCRNWVNYSHKLSNILYVDLLYLNQYHTRYIKTSTSELQLTISLDFKDKNI